MTSTIILEPLPGESLYSLIGRIGLVNGHSTATTSKQLLGSLEGYLFADTEINWKSFQQSTRGLYGELESVLTNLTNLPFRTIVSTPLITGENSRKWRRAADRGDLTLVATSQHDSHLWRWCPECTKEDKAQTEFSYWHLTHQLPGYYVCVIHGRCLSEIKVPFRDRQKDFLTPDSFAQNEVNEPLINSRGFEMAAGLSQIVSQLNVTEFNYLQETFRETIRERLVYLGYTTDAGIVRSEAVTSFSQFFEEMKAWADIRGILTPLSIRKQIHAIFTNSEITAKNPIILPMLLMWLFRNWPAYQASYDWQKVLYDNNREVRTNCLLKGNATLEDHRQICKSYRLEHPDHERKNFWKLIPKTSRYLHTRDKEWFDLHFPMNMTLKGSQRILFED